MDVYLRSASTRDMLSFGLYSRYNNSMALDARPPASTTMRKSCFGITNVMAANALLFLFHDSNLALSTLMFASSPSASAWSFGQSASPNVPSGLHAMETAKAPIVARAVNFASHMTKSSFLPENGGNLLMRLLLPSPRSIADAGTQRIPKITAARRNMACAVKKFLRELDRIVAGEMRAYGSVGVGSITVQQYRL